MGLDMYLNKKTYVKNWDYMKPEELHKITVEKGGKPSEDIRPERISYIEEGVGYWRKFNALHNWFVSNVQGGVDDCRAYFVDRAKLEELMETLKTIQNDKRKADKTLPTAQGFFFGSDDYDEYYFQQVETTITLLEELLKEKGGEFYYEASW